MSRMFPDPKANFNRSKKEFEDKLNNLETQIMRSVFSNFVDQSISDPAGAELIRSSFGLEDEIRVAAKNQIFNDLIEKNPEIKAARDVGEYDPNDAEKVKAQIEILAKAKDKIETFRNQRLPSDPLKMGFEAAVKRLQPMSKNKPRDTSADVPRRPKFK